MKRKSRDDTPKGEHSTGDIKADLTEKQLAAFGAAALAYNVLEDQIDALLFFTTRIPDWLFAEVSSRIHGLDGKTAIIQEAIKHSDLNATDTKMLTEAVATFGDFKKTRDAMIHARIINVTTAVGRGAKQRGKSPYEVLLSADALNAFYDHIVALKNELASAAALLNSSITLKLSNSDDPNRPQIEEALRVHQAQYRENRNRRRSMKPLPKFPDEDELRQVANQQREAQIAAQMGWFQPWSAPQRPQQMSAALHAATTGVFGPPLPATTEKK
jgi:hypothetical protein